MTIEDLLISLTSYILRYHDSQPTNKPIIAPESNTDLLQEKYREHALKTLKDTKVNYVDYLTGLIKEGEKNYAGRLPLLFYILNEITVLKSMTDRKTSFSPIELENYKKQMTQMLIDLRQLVITIKGSTYNVKYSSIIEDGKETPEKSISLSGTASYSYITGHSLCTSGSLLTDALLKRFNITITSSDAYIEDIAKVLCNGCQNALLVPEHLLKAEQLTQKAEQLTQKAEELTQLSDKQQEKIALQESTIQKQESLLQEQSSSIKILTEKLEALPEEAKDPTGESLEEDETLKSKLETALGKIAELEATIVNLKKVTINPFMLGVASSTLFGLNNPKYAKFKLGQTPQVDSEEDSTKKLGITNSTLIE